MFAKLLVILIVAIAIGGVVLSQRNRRLATMHEMARLHVEIDRTRRETWDLQVRIAQETDSDTLRSAIERTGVAIEPLYPAPYGDHPAPALAQRTGGQ